MKSEENILDLIGWDLSKALENLENAGWHTTVTFTCPAKSQPDGRARVIRLTRGADKKVAVVAARQVLKGGM